MDMLSHVKMIALSVDKYDKFMSKQENFTEIDDLLGPDAKLLYELRLYEYCTIMYPCMPVIRRGF